jgi:threonine/homoserine/homoserine lactone efflux protein
VELFAFIVSVVVLTASGALAPGPLLIANITQGTKSGAKGGLAFSAGHTVFEASLVTVLAFTLQKVSGQPLIQLAVEAIGGVALLIFGLTQIHGALTSKAQAVAQEDRSRNPFLLGAIFTGLNPYFIIWWLTVGMTLIVTALNLASFAGVLIMYISHVWMDYAWLIAWAYFARKGTVLMGSRGYRILMIIFGGILIVFGSIFLASVFQL